MHFVSPNSCGRPEIDEANAESSHGWLTRQPPRRKYRFREFNACHSPADGTFCAGRTAARGAMLKKDRRAAVVDAFRKVASGNEAYPLGMRDTKVRVNRGLSRRADTARRVAMTAPRNLDREQAAYDRVKTKDAMRRTGRFGTARPAATFSKPSIDRIVRAPRRVRRKA